jgi:putative membrane protein
MSMLVLWVKALHIVFVAAWFAGLFYLPRIFVNLAMESEPGVVAVLLRMAGKLYRFMTPLGLLALGFGLWLWLGFGIAGAWLHAKLALVLLLIGYHLWCGRILEQFRSGRNARSHRWYRVFNEVPVVILLGVVVLVTVKPF